MAGDSIKLTQSEIAAMFAEPDYAARFPPVLTVDQAAELVQVPKATIYAWSSAGQLKSCARRVGKHLRILRDRFLQCVLTGGLQHTK